MKSIVKDTICFSKQLKQLNKTTPEVGYDNDNITQISEKRQKWDMK